MLHNCLLAQTDTAFSGFCQLLCFGTEINARAEMVCKSLPAWTSTLHAQTPLKRIGEILAQKP